MTTAPHLLTPAFLGQLTCHLSCWISRMCSPRTYPPWVPQTMEAVRNEKRQTVGPPEPMGGAQCRQKRWPLFCWNASTLPLHSHIMPKSMPCAGIGQRYFMMGRAAARCVDLLDVASGHSVCIFRGTLRKNGSHATTSCANKSHISMVT